MKLLKDKDTLFVFVSHIVSAILMIVGSILLVLKGQTLEVMIIVLGFFVFVLAVLILLKKVDILKYFMPILYFLIGVVYFIGFILDIINGYLNIGSAAEIIAGILFIFYGYASINKLSSNKRIPYLRAIEVFSCFIMAACVFFVLFSDASFGYLFSKINGKVSLQKVDLILIFVGYTILSISNSTYGYDE
jgi:hypothetical protein